MTMPHLRWDVFCQVIDNFGDMGVCWRLCADLAERGQHVRLWTNDASALAWMAPGGHPRVQVLPWPQQAPADGVGDVVVEAFGCDIATEFIAAMARPVDENGYSDSKPSLWINLEYLSAEPYVERCHGLPSPLMSGPGAGMTRWFFYPGFTAATGGLLREPGLLVRQAGFERALWRQHQGVTAGALAVSLFCYEPPALQELLMQFAQWPQGPVQLLVTPGRAAAAVRALHPPEASESRHSGALTMHYLPPRSQAAFDELLWACDLNCVRGEDSLVRALWAGEPLVWHIYPQHDDAHHAKLDAFLDWLQAPASLRQFHHAWNGLTPPHTLPAINPEMLAQWRNCVQAARARLLAQHDLLTQLLGFANEKR